MVVKSSRSSESLDDQTKTNNSINEAPHTKGILLKFNHAHHLFFFNSGHIFQFYFETQYTLDFFQ